MEHVFTQKIIAYLSGKLSELESAGIETHLAACAACAKEVLRYRLVARHFDELWDSMTVRNLEGEVIRGRLLDAATAGESADRITRQQADAVRCWAENLAEKTDLALSINIMSASGVPRLNIQNIKGLSEHATIGEFAHVPQPSVHGKGDRRKAEIVRGRNEAGEQATLYLEPGRIVLERTRKGRKGKSPLALLYNQENGSLLGFPFRRPRGNTEKNLVSEIEGIPDGMYTLLVIKG